MTGRVGFVVFAVSASCASTGSSGNDGPRPAGGAAACGSFAATVEGGQIDLAPPDGFMETCSVNEGICGALAPARGDGVATLGLFLTSADWVRHRRGQRLELGDYLIAQSSPMPDAQFPALKKLIRERPVMMPSSAITPEALGALDKIELGVVDEDAGSISSAVLMGALPSAYLHSTAPQFAISTAVLLRGRVLSLHTHHAFVEQRDLETTRRVAADWLACLRKANPAPPARN